MRQKNERVEADKPGVPCGEEQRVKAHKCGELSVVAGVANLTQEEAVRWSKSSESRPWFNTPIMAKWFTVADQSR